jgi:two-component system LytT family response regulator
MVEAAMRPAPLRALIVDDEALARATIVGLLAADPEVVVAGECAAGAEATAAIAAAPPDLLFLDIQMPEVDGFEVLRRTAAERIGAIVFVTAYDTFALRAFEAQALDYLLKPFDDDRFRRTLARAKERVRERKTHRLTRELLGYLGAADPMRSNGVAAGYLERLAVKANGRVSLLRVEDLDWIEAADYCVRIHAGGRVHVLREALKDLEARLDPRRFFRVHRSAIVNLSRIRELCPLYNGESVLVLLDGTQLRLSRSRREQLHLALGVSA